MSEFFQYSNHIDDLQFMIDDCVLYIKDGYSRHHHTIHLQHIQNNQGRHHEERSDVMIS